MVPFKVGEWSWWEKGFGCSRSQGSCLDEPLLSLGVERKIWMPPSAAWFEFIGLKVDKGEGRWLKG